MLARLGRTEVEVFCADQREISSRFRIGETKGGAFQPTFDQSFFETAPPPDHGDSGGMTIRDAAETDLPAIVAIFNAAVPTRMSTAVLEPVSVEERLPWFREHSPERHPLWVLEMENRIAGWLSFHPFISA